jgi:hypothetical protein
VTGRPPLWTPEEARAEADREGEPESSGSKAWGWLSVLSEPLGCLVPLVVVALLPGLLLVGGGILLLR